MEFEKKASKIFVLSGKASSGKNSTFSIIKDYYKDKKVIGLSFAYYIKDYAKRVSDWDGSEEKKPRELLQSIGIELVRNKIDKELFIRRLLEDIIVFSYFYDIIVVTDARLVDEMEALKSKFPSAVTIRLNRDAQNDLTASEKQHMTEVDLDNYNKFDYVVESDEKLKEKILDILRSVKDE